MNQLNDTEYLQRPLIDGMVYTINEDYMRISCPGTIFAEARRLSRLDKDEILGLYQNVLQTAQSKGIKISYSNHMKKQIVEGWAEYEISVAEAQNLFKDIIAQSNVVRDRGVHMGCSDDSALDKLTALSSKYSGFFQRNSIVSKTSDIRDNLERLQADLSKPDSKFDMIYL